MHIRCYISSSQGFNTSISGTSPGMDNLSGIVIPMKHRITLLAATVLLLHAAAAMTASPEKQTSPAMAPECEQAKRIHRNKGKLPLVHRHGACSPFRDDAAKPWPETLLDTIAGDRQRFRHIGRRLRGRELESFTGEALEGESQSLSFVVELGLGTPAQNFFMLIDTGSNLAWLHCTGCSGCSSSAVFDPALSSSYAEQSCGSQACSAFSSSSDYAGCGNGRCLFNLTYVDGTAVTGPLATEVLTVGLDSRAGFAFGCASTASGNGINLAGLVGLGRGNFSLVSQEETHYGRMFGYCLPKYTSETATGYLLLGNSSVVNFTALSYTPLLTNPAIPIFYYVELQGISVDGSAVDFPAGALELDTATGRGGVIVDSGTSITGLAEAVYSPFSSAFKAAAESRGLTTTVDPTNNFDTCFVMPTGSSDVVPQVTLRFAGGMNVALSVDHIVVQVTSDVLCLAFSGYADGENQYGISIWGNFQQTNMLFLFEVANARLGLSSGC